jgi:hypothetical protein
MTPTTTVREGVNAWRDAAEIRIRAEYRLGKMLASAKAHGGIAEGRPKLSSPTTVSPTLAELGVSRDLSSRAQAIASLPKEPRT